MPIFTDFQTLIPSLPILTPTTMCKGFGSTLIGPALQWYINIPTRSISSFAGLSDKFVEQFASNRSLGKTSDGLYEILQHRVEPLRDYIARFNQEKVAVPECSIPTVISAFKRGPLPDGGLYKELIMYPCKTMEDVLSRAWAQVKWEEDVVSRARLSQSRTKGQPDQIEETEMKDPPKGDPRALVVETGASSSTGRKRRKKGCRSTNYSKRGISSRSLEKTSDGLYEILQHRVEPLRDYIARFNQEKVAVPECSIPTVIYAFKRGLLPDGGLYKELIMYPCKTMEDVLSRAWAQVKWEEDVASRAKAQPKQDQRSARSDRGDRDERSSQRGSKGSGSRNRGRFQYRPQEKEEGMSVKWPPKMKAPDLFRNPGLWCDFHRDHGHKTEDCIALRIKVNELSKRGISEKSSQRKPRPTSAKRKQGNPKELHQPHHLAKIG
ncbi:hypothetical protein F2Q69_00013830 [Brassica cretica]|uniref:Retrotransposon gag domain-containing protein n=1 Tax=Brassica cretica TaxID=69181 RepID=A0A8S9R1Y8_BRACR|nr:hypothetical protein F2Q69_00013830 [Brassica cretica]